MKMSFHEGAITFKLALQEYPLYLNTWLHSLELRENTFILFKPFAL